ncbi:MAG TPA: hypothetical protein VL500_00545 [Candidatus Eisenbacteria bacterium]|jgi:hypothetical protein|nr:hypothetical protein [Candidatus Eisenbacteria bacterium]
MEYGIILILAVIVLLLVLRTRDLKRGQQVWMRVACANHAAATQPMPPAAETIKLANFERVIDQRDRSADENRALMRQLRDARLELRESDETIRLLSEESRSLRRTLDEEKAKNLHLGGLYKHSEIERQRLALENQRYREERRTTAN